MHVMPAAGWCAACKAAYPSLCKIPQVSCCFARCPVRACIQEQVLSTREGLQHCTLPSLAFKLCCGYAQRKSFGTEWLYRLGLLGRSKYSMQPSVSLACVINEQWWEGRL